MALIELTPDDLCAMQSYPFPCEEGTIIDPISVAHQLGLVETSASIFEALKKSKPERAPSKADPRLLMLSLACSMEASRAVTQARTVSSEAAPGGADGVDLKAALADFVDGVIASPPVLSTVIPPAGTVIVVGTIIIKIPNPPPIPPRWEKGELIARTHLLAMATRFQAASKMSGIGEVAEDLAYAATRLIDAALSR